MPAFRKLPPKTGRGAKPVTRKLMEQANALDAALRAIRKIVPKISQLEDDFAHAMIEDIQKEYMAQAKAQAKRTNPSIYDENGNPCWRCAHVPTELIAKMAQTPERLNELFATSPSS